MRDGLLAWEAPENVRVKVEFGKVKVKKCSLSREFAYLLVVVCVC